MLNYLKILDFRASKDTRNRVKGESTEGEKKTVNHTADEGFYLERIKYPTREQHV